MSHTSRWNRPLTGLFEANLRKNLFTRVPPYKFQYQLKRNKLLLNGPPIAYKNDTLSWHQESFNNSTVMAL